MRLRLLLFSMFLSAGLMAQNVIEEAYIPVTDQSKKYPLLEYVYGNINYPSVARYNGTTALIKVDYTVLRDGRVKVDSVLVITDKVDLDTIDQKQLIRVIAYQEGGTFTMKIPREGTKRYERYLAKRSEGERALAIEVLRVFEGLPMHQPATVNGTALNRSYWHLVAFDLE